MQKSQIVKLKESVPKLSLLEGEVGVLVDQGKDISQVYFLRPNSKFSVSSKIIHSIDPTEYGDSFDYKICNVCHRIHKTDFFDLNQNGKNNRPVRRPSCKDCRKDIDGVAMSAKDKKEWEKTKPINTNFECPICKKITIAGITSKVVLNHDHQSGRILGWICDSCNTGLGRFKDNIEILQRAIDYLKTH
jgi:hypothetical protein